MADSEGRRATSHSWNGYDIIKYTTGENETKQGPRATSLVVSPTDSSATEHQNTDNMTEFQPHEVVVVGGGPAGTTAAMYTTCLGHDTALIDRDGGRASLMWNTHNVIGITEDTSGREFIDIAANQLDDYGTRWYSDRVTEITSLPDHDHQFQVEANQRTLLADRVVLATGFNDKPSNVSMLGRFMGRGPHY